MGSIVPALATAVLVALTASAAAWAGQADVVGAEAIREPHGSWRFDVTVRHADEGWEHYADAFEVLAPDGTVLATRTLYHPHVNEQPFTRSLGGVTIPPGISEVTVRAHDSVHSYGGAVATVTLPAR